MAFGRALLFLAVTSPIWALKKSYAVFHPVGLLALALALTLLFLWWDKRSPAVLGLDPKPRRLAELGLGFLGGALLVSAIAVVMYFVLPFPWQRNEGFRLDQATWSLSYLLIANAVEELVFRGYAFERMISAIGLWPAQIITALIFAVYHVLHGWSWNAALVGTTLGSILFGLVFVRWTASPRRSVSTRPATGCATCCCRIRPRHGPSSHPSPCASGRRSSSSRRASSGTASWCSPAW